VAEAEVGVLRPRVGVVKGIKTGGKGRNSGCRGRKSGGTGKLGRKGEKDGREGSRCQSRVGSSGFPSFPVAGKSKPGTRVGKRKLTIRRND
jgi:hypothetical protein